MSGIILRCLMRRKLFCVSAAMVFGIHCGGVSIIAAAGIALAAFFYCSALYMRPELDSMKMRSALTCCVIAFIIGAFRMQAEMGAYDAAERICGGKAHEITGIVKQAERKPGKNPAVILEVTAVDGERTGSGMIRGCIVTLGEKNRAKNSADAVWKLTGRIVSIRTYLTIPDGARNPGCFDYREYLRSRGISCTAYAGKYRLTGDSRSGRCLRALIGFRERFLDIIAPPDAGDSRAVLRGVLFGDTQEMTDDMKDDFRRNGTAHILAVSGLHIGLMYSLFVYFRKKTGLKYVTPAFVMVLLAYGTVTVWSVSVTRAIAMILIMEAGNALDRRYDILTSLGLVSMLVLMHNPYALYGASFMMSYLAVLSMGMIWPKLDRMLPAGFPGMIKASLCVQAGLLPYTAYTFNMVPLGSLLINIPTVLLVSVIVPAGVSAAPFVMLSGFLPLSGYAAGAVGYVCRILTEIMVMINRTVSQLGILSPDVPSPPVLIVILAYASIALFCSESFLISRLRKDVRMTALHLGLAILVTAAVTISCVNDFDKADFIMVGVGQGDCMHFTFRGTWKDDGIRSLLPCDDADVLIDGGGREGYDIGEKTLKPYLLKNGRSDIDLALATHLHMDHYLGLKQLSDSFRVKQLITTGAMGDRYSLPGGGRIEIIWPPERDPDTDDENRNSLIYKVYIRGVTVLITGDLGEEGEKEMTEHYRGTDTLDCDVLKVSHHGSRSSSSEEFLEAVSPEIALIGVGKNNNYGHPSDEAVERLEKAGARVFRTDRDGAIGIRVMKKGIVLLQEDP